MRGFRASRAAKNLKSSHFGKPEQPRSNEGENFTGPQNVDQQRKNLPSWVRVPESVLKEQQGSTEAKGQPTGQRRPVQNQPAKQQQQVAKVIPIKRTTTVTPEKPIARNAENPVSTKRTAPAKRAESAAPAARRKTTTAVATRKVASARPKPKTAVAKRAAPKTAATPKGAKKTKRAAA